MPIVVPDHIMWEEFSQEHADECSQILRWFVEVKSTVLRSSEPITLDVPIYVTSTFSNEPELLAFFEFLSKTEARVWKQLIEALKNDPEFSEHTLTHFRIMNRLDNWREYGACLLKDTDDDTS